MSTFGSYAIVQRCREHKRRNVLEHLSQVERTFVNRKLNKAWSEPDARRAEAQLRALAKHLETQHPGAAGSLLEGLEETLTVTRLGLNGSLLDTFKSTNPIESLNSMARDVTGNVKRWRNGKMVVRWMAASLLDAETRFRRVKGYRDMPLLRIALRRHHQAVDSIRRSA
jgi:transposase-like protein